MTGHRRRLPTSCICFRNSAVPVRVLYWLFALRSRLRAMLTGNAEGKHKARSRATPTMASSSPRLRHRLARERRDAQRRDAIALATQHPEAEAVEGEGLSRF